MDIAVSAKKLKGIISPPPFKSAVIRTLILGALCSVHPAEIIGDSEPLCDDIAAAKIAVENAFFCARNTDEPIFVGASATLLRLIAPVLLFQRSSICFSCEPQLLRRDMSELSKALACSTAHDTARQTICFLGADTNRERYTVCAEKSSQFASGLLIAAAVFGFGVCITSPVSMPYIDLTLKCLRKFGCVPHIDPNGFCRFSGELRAPSRYSFEPDTSYAANFICADMLSGSNGDIIIKGFERGRNQSDFNAAKLFAMDELDIADSPDLFPLVCIHALSKNSTTLIRGTDRLRDKESDRISAVHALFDALGGMMDVYKNQVVVHGCGGRLHGGIVDSFGDHRIVMAAAIASLMCSDAVIIRGAESVSKSAPRFFDDFCTLGGITHELIWN